MEYPILVTVRPISGDAELDTVHRITHDAYVRNGYCSPQADGRLIHYPHLESIPETIVLVALLNSTIIGTNSLTRDGSRGLHVDADFRPEVDAIRGENRILGSSWRIITAPVAGRSSAVVIALIGATMTAMVTSGIETLLCTFNPRHLSVYTRLLNMRMMGFRDNTIGLTNAPAVLMRLDWEDIPDKYMP